MKKFIAMCAMMTTSLCLFACFSRGSVEVPCADFYEHQHISKGVEVPANSSFTVTLCSNPSTGFKWGETEISDQTVVALVDHTYDSLEGRSPPAPGTPGEEVWTFKALKQGESSISIEYGQPWEGGMKAEWTFALTVVVQ